MSTCCVRGKIGRRSRADGRADHSHQVRRHGPVGRRPPTAKDGTAEVALDMPENLTTWRIKVWGMGHGTKVGQG